MMVHSAQVGRASSLSLPDNGRSYRIRDTLPAALKTSKKKKSDEPSTKEPASQGSKTPVLLVVVTQKQGLPGTGLILSESMP